MNEVYGLEVLNRLRFVKRTIGSSYWLDSGLLPVGGGVWGCDAWMAGVGWGVGGWCCGCWGCFMLKSDVAIPKFDVTLCQSRR
jgi:hypothetical protein